MARGSRVEIPLRGLQDMTKDIFTTEVTGRETG